MSDYYTPENISELDSGEVDYNEAGGYYEDSAGNIYDSNGDFRYNRSDD